MARIDVTEILSDPDFADEVIQIVREDRVNSAGQNTLFEEAIPTIGIVQPASGQTLQRLPDSLRNQDVKSFWLKGQIHGTADCKYPDILVFEGVRYAVQLVLPWTNWGQGWCEGVCIAERPA